MSVKVREPPEYPRASHKPDNHRHMKEVTLLMTGGCGAKTGHPAAVPSHPRLPDIVRFRERLFVSRKSEPLVYREALVWPVLELAD